MVKLVVRQDPIEMTGRVVSISPPSFIDQPATWPVGKWTFLVKPDPPHQALLTTRNGNTNIDGTIACMVGVDERVVSSFQLLPLVSTAFGRRVRVVGTWCDDDDGVALTVIYPLGILAVEYDIEVYDINRWPVAVRDVDLFAFAHATDGLAARTEPHAGESRTLTVALPFPYPPSNTAIPFWRAYKSTQVDHTSAVTFTPVNISGTGPVKLVATIDTGAPADGKGFFAAQLGLTFDEPDLNDFCPPGTCDLDGKHCAYEGRSRYMLIPAHLPDARKGDLALSPGDGKGLISGIVASLTPPQVYDHMGIFVDNGWTIRHCTSSQERVEDEDLFTAKISVELAGVIKLTNQKVPLNGLRPDLVRFGWPGSITQTVEEVYRTGRNTLNSRWSYAATHPGQDVKDPERPGVPFRIYHLPRADRQRRLQFNDPERDKGEWIVRLQDTSVRVGDPLKEFRPQLVRPHPQFDSQVRPTLELVADMASKIEAHYRFFAYSKGDIGLDPAFTAPPSSDPRWGSLPQGANWPAGTVPAMCSSFVWTAVQLANQNRPAGMPPIVLEDQADPPDPMRGLEYGSRDGFYQYHAEEGRNAATKLVTKIQQKIFDRFDNEIPKLAYAALPQLSLYREMTARHVTNQIANAFIFDKCETIDDAWSVSREGETASPDDTLCFWDLKPHQGELNQPEGGQAIYGDSCPILLPPPKWGRMPLFRKQDIDLGTGKVTGLAFVSGALTAGVTVSFDFGCRTAMTTDNRDEAFFVELGTGIHFAEAFIILPNPATGNIEKFRTPQPVQFEVKRGQVTRIDLRLEPPPDLWRILDVHLDADIHDRSFWGGDADSREFHDDQHFELRQDLEDDPMAPEDQRNTVLHLEKVWRTEPQVGSGVHVAVAIIANLNPADRSVHCGWAVALIDEDDGGSLGIKNSSTINAHHVDQVEHGKVVIPTDQTVDVLKDVDFASHETVPERARVSLRLTNRRRPS